MFKHRLSSFLLDTVLKEISYAEGNGPELGPFQYRHHSKGILTANPATLGPKKSMAIQNWFKTRAILRSRELPAPNLYPQEA